MVLTGRLSYSIYLFHLIARTPGEAVFGSPHKIGSIVSGLFLTGALAYVVFIFVDLPIANIRRRLRGKESLVPLATAINLEGGATSSNHISARRRVHGKDDPYYRRYRLHSVWCWLYSWLFFELDASDQRGNSGVASFRPASDGPGSTINQRSCALSRRP